MRLLNVKFGFLVYFAAALLVCPLQSLYSQIDPGEVQTGTPDASPTPTPEPTPIDLSAVVIEAESTNDRLETILKALSKDYKNIQIEQGLDELNTRAGVLRPESETLLSQRPSLEALRTIEQDWQALSRNIPVWKSTLSAQTVRLDAFLRELARFKEIWKKTIEALKITTGSGDSQETVRNEKPAETHEIPPAVAERMKATLRAVEKAERDVAQTRSRVLTLQTKVSKQEETIKEVLDSISSLREQALANLFVRDSVPLWSAGTSVDSMRSLFAEAGRSYSLQFDALSEYMKKTWDGLIVHALVFLTIALLLFQARRRLRRFVDEDADLEPAFSVFEHPVAIALILSILASSWFYPQAPRVLSALLGAAALVPGILYLRKILERPIFPVLNALVVFYFVDQIRYVTSTLPLLSRVLFLAEMFAALVFFIIYLRTRNDDGHDRQDIFILVKKVIPLLLIMFALAIAANILGWVSFSYVLGNGVMGSVYSALIIYAGVQIVKSLAVFALRIRPISGLGIVKGHRELVKTNVFKWLKWAGVVFWILVTLNVFAVRAPVFGFVMEWLTAELEVGSISISLSDLLIFGFTIWLTFVFSRLLRFVLQEDVYPRTSLAAGTSYAASTILHYVLLVAGFLIAIAAIGIDLTKFTILAGAVGVGLGFGMQAIVNNFVSGLILLFERPVEVDDFVQVGTYQGSLKRIGLRASVLRTMDGSEVIVPNGQLISEEVTNWTFSDQERRLDIDVGVAYGSDPRQVLELLKQVAEANPDVIQDPEPRSLFIRFGDSSLDFQLRAWTDKLELWVQVQSDLTLAVHDALYEAGIEIPFPQRDIHIRGNSTDEKKTENSELKTEK